MREQKLWESLRRAIPTGAHYTRIETGLIKTGVSDVEYVHPPWHGWVELKVGLVPRTSVHVGRAQRSLHLQHPFSFAQWSWLVSHHDPAHYLRSWLLVGLHGRSIARWESFLLLSAPAAVLLLDGREHLTPYHVLLARPGVSAYKQAKAVLEAIAGPNRTKE